MLIADRWQSMSAADGAAVAASLLCAYILSTAIYRLYFHPLAHYPGPFWARLSTIPSWWHTRKGNRHIWLFQLQEKYGTTFRYRPDSVLINTPTAYRTIFGPKGNVRKSDYYQLWPRTVDTLNTWNCTDIDVHMRKRRVLNNAFSDKALRSAEPFILANVDRWCDLLGQEAGDGWSKSLNVADWINYLVFDILGDLCFGKSFDMKEPSSQMRYVIELMGEFLQVMHPIAFSPVADFWLWLKPRGLDTLMAKHSPPAVQAWQKFVDGCLAERTRVEEQGSPGGGAPRKDFFHYLFGAVDPETGKPGYGQAELYGECELLIIAGSDTTSTVLSALFFYLARDEAVKARLVAELRGAFASAADIRAGPALTGCQYLHAFIQEGLRMTPPVSAEPSRQVLAGGATVDGHFFPAGTRLSTGLYCLSYSADVYPDPFRFRPERFLPGAPGTTPEGVAAAQQALCAFSSGTRGCPGKNLAWLEMTVVVAKVLFAFDVRPDPTSRLGAGDPAGPPGRRAADQYQTYDAFVSLRDGPMVQFKRREGAWP